MSALTKPCVVPTQSEYSVTSCWTTLVTVTSGTAGAAVGAVFPQPDGTTAIAAMKIPAAMNWTGREIKALRCELIGVRSCSLQREYGSTLKFVPVSLNPIGARGCGSKCPTGA